MIRKEVVVVVVSVDDDDDVDDEEEEKEKRKRVTCLKKLSTAGKLKLCYIFINNACYT